MLPLNTVFPAPSPTPGRAGMGPVLMGAWIGGSTLGALALWSGFGWVAALAAYGLGGSLLLVGLAVLPHLEHSALDLQPAPIRVARGPRLRP